MRFDDILALICHDFFKIPQRFIYKSEKRFLMVYGWSFGKGDHFLV